MAEALGTTAAVIGIASAAWSSAKSLYDFVSSFRDAPKALEDLIQDTGIIAKQLETLATQKPTNARSLSNTQRATLRDLEPALEGCQNACEDLESKIRTMTSHSSDGRVSKRDRLALMFQDKDVAILKARLGSYKQSLVVALGVANMKNMENNQEEMRQYQSNLSTSLSSITGQIQGIQLALQGLSLSDGTVMRTKAEEHFVARSEAANALRVLDEHDQALKQCLKFVAGVFPETAGNSGLTIGEVQAFNEARQFVGNVDGQTGPSIKIDKLTANDKAWQITGNVTGDAVSNFFR